MLVVRTRRKDFFGFHRGKSVSILAILLDPIGKRANGTLTPYCHHLHAPSAAATVFINTSESNMAQIWVFSGHPQNSSAFSHHFPIMSTPNQEILVDSLWWFPQTLGIDYWLTLISPSFSMHFDIFPAPGTWWISR